MFRSTPSRFRGWRDGEGWREDVRVASYILDPGSIQIRRRPYPCQRPSYPLQPPLHLQNNPDALDPILYSIPISLQHASCRILQSICTNLSRTIQGWNDSIWLNDDADILNYLNLTVIISWPIFVMIYSNLYHFVFLKLVI